MNPVQLTLIEKTNRLNGYGMPIARVKSDGKIDVINRGWNEFDSVQDIDISALDLRDFANLSNDQGCFKSYHVHLEIEGARDNDNPLPVWLYFSEWINPEHKKYNKSYLQW